MGPIWQFIDSSGIGGIERHVEILAGGLLDNQKACEVIIYADHDNNCWLKQLKAAHIPFRVLGGSVTEFTSALRLHKPSLVHTHGYKAGILGRSAARLLNIPAVSTFHSGERGNFPVSLYQKFDEISAFLAPSIAVSSPIKERLPFEADLVHNFVKVPTNLSLPQRDRLQVGFVGRFSHEKAPDYYCALTDMLSSAPNFDTIDWHAYGDGPMLDELRQAYGDHISFHGVETDMDSVWPTLDLLVIPSRDEGLPLAALEALSYGIPVVASSLGALPEAVKHRKTGWLFPPGNLDAAADHMTEWADLTQSEREQQFHLCRAHVQKNFSIQSGLASILNIYNKSGLDVAA